MTKYCFQIYNPNSVPFDSNELKNFVKSLYDGILFDGVIYIEEEQISCIVVSSVSKSNTIKIESQNNLFEIPIKWENGISLGKPSKFTFDKSVYSSSDLPHGHHWKTLKHSGPYFPHLMYPYKPIGASLLYDGKKYPLTPTEEEVAIFYAKRKITDKKTTKPCTDDKLFNSNFWKDFKTYLSKDHKKIFKNFSKINWDDLVTQVEESQKNNDLTTEEKKRNDLEKMEILHKYQYAIIDGRKEQIGNLAVEAPGLFQGMGTKQIRGRIKPKIMPKDVTINVGVNDPIPNPPAGHRWGSVVHRPNVRYLATWKDVITKRIKHINFSRGGSLKGIADHQKFDISRKLQLHIETIREKYEIDAKSSDLKKMQLATVLYLIDNYGIRVGNETDKDDEAEVNVVGATTLKVGNITLLKNHEILFKFIGKDSIEFNQILKLSTQIYKNINRLVKNKKPTDDLFNKVSSADINNYLQKI